MAGGGNQAMKTPIRKGKVYLMGAGPGNPELLTLQAAQILKSSKVVFLSHHMAGNVSPEWHDVALKDATYAVYMPGKNYGEIATKLMDSGLDAATPCVIVANATQAGQQVHRTTLQELALEERLPAPSLVIIGEVAKPLPAAEKEKDDSGWETPAKTNE